MITKKYINSDGYYDHVIFNFSHGGREKNRVKTITLHYQKAPFLFMGYSRLGRYPIFKGEGIRESWMISSFELALFSFLSLQI